MDLFDLNYLALQECLKGRGEEIEGDIAVLRDRLKDFLERQDAKNRTTCPVCKKLFVSRTEMLEHALAKTPCKRRLDEEVAAQFAAEQAIRIAFWSSGTGLPATDDQQLAAVLRTQTNKALKIERSGSVMTLAALALAIGGLTKESDALVHELSKERQKDTLINELWIPTIRAASELQKERAKDAIETLEIAERFEKEGDFYQRYIRALAYLKLDKVREAVDGFNKILEHRGESVLSSIYPLAQLGKARALKDKTEYEKFFEIWDQADKDMPALVAAREEYEEL